jgi:hypothetical protein
MAQNHMPKVGKRVQNDAAREIPSLTTIIIFTSRIPLFGCNWLQLLFCSADPVQYPGLTI